MLTTVVAEASSAGTKSSNNARQAVGTLSSSYS
eukprot:CAMPEP_0177784590 /NCGR_PEP_ID=MMETSP0491_2-20121128/19809_1 /TAXON_ID=63592 /ORGANISM="Tetraselmis chuii, Strain PLY429" /LENGTH=32 /DNA_ID= /DNA_START= /DNA_END= /DNA_ORIENTATION=